MIESLSSLAIRFGGGGAAWLANHFVTDRDFISKKVILFAASSSSPLGSSGSDLTTMVGTGDWQEGQRLSSNASAGEVSSWVESLDL
ncbi:flavodoxin [Bifidobacterium catenulatum]|uniref:flavodoxin n=1 Tax=Bifidobacterium catenulatum TaxID=1686 RepID=UPI0032BF9114